jgi:hypothetical protein
MREALDQRLAGLYGQAGDEDAFDALAVDKQQALLLLAQRFLELDLWDGVQRVENVYGLGGVGMSFIARPRLKSSLVNHRAFTGHFARHRRTTGGFRERRRPCAALHLLYVEQESCCWMAHFDLYNPWSTPLNAWRHLWYEKLRGQTPDWRTIKATMNAAAMSDER